MYTSNDPMLKHTLHAHLYFSLTRRHQSSFGYLSGNSDPAIQAFGPRTACRSTLQATLISWAPADLALVMSSTSGATLPSTPSGRAGLRFSVTVSYVRCIELISSSRPGAGPTSQAVRRPSTLAHNPAHNTVSYSMHTSEAITLGTGPFIIEMPIACYERCALIIGHKL